jgi:hypothetical protein
MGAQCLAVDNLLYATTQDRYEFRGYSKDGKLVRVIRRVSASTDTLPAYRGAEVDVAQNLWVREFALKKDSIDRYLVFGPDGRLRARAALPSLVVSRLGDDYVTTTEETADGQPVARVWHLRKAKPRK